MRLPTDRIAGAKTNLPRRERGRLGEPLSSRRLGRDRHCSAVVAGGGAGAADFLGHGVEREALGAGDGALFEVMGPRGEHEQLAVGAGVEVTAGGLELRGEAVFKENDQGKAVRKGGAGDFLFAGADAGRDENRAALADQLAENRPAAVDFKRNHVDAALVVVVAEATALHRMDFGFGLHTHGEESLKHEFKKVKEAA